MNIVICLKDQAVYDRLKFVLESQFSIYIFKSLAHKKGTDLVVTDDLSQCRSKDSAMPYIVISSSKMTIGEEDQINVIGATSAGSLPDGLIDLLKDKFANFMLPKLSKPTDNQEVIDHEYCEIETPLLIRVSPLKADVFIRLSGTKYVRIFQEGDSFDRKDFEKYTQQKKIKYFYLRKAELGEFVAKLRQDIVQLLKVDIATIRDPNLITEATHHTVQNLIETLGPDPEVQDIIKANISLSVKTLGSNPSLNKILKRIAIGRHQYIASHSIMLGHLACAIAAAMEWKSESTFYKLNLAAYLHDITLHNHALAAVTNLLELYDRASEFTEAEFQKYRTHSLEASEIAKSFNEVPADVDTIILQHHERPDGTGFPRSLTHTRIAPLSSVFIAAHDLLNYVLSCAGKEINLKEFVSKVKPEYTGGNFKKLLKIISEMKL